MIPQGRPEGGPGASPPGDPWIESRQGSVFFVNAVLVFPHVMVAVPLATRTFLRSLGRVPTTSPILDTFPTIAEYLLPRAGFLLLVPLGLAVYNLRIEGDGLTRAALWGFLVAHAGAFAWGLGVLAGLWSPVLPGGP